MHGAHYVAVAHYAKRLISFFYVYIVSINVEIILPAGKSKESTLMFIVFSQKLILFRYVIPGKYMRKNSIAT